MIKMLFAFLFVVVFTLVFSYFVLYKAKNNWSVIPRPLRYVVLPCYCFIIVFIACFLFQFYYFIPNALQWVFNIIIGLLGIKWLIVVWIIFSDILVLPYFLCCIAVAAILPTFEGEKLYTFVYRKIVLLVVTIILVYEFTIDTLDGLEWYENALFVVSILLTSVFVYFFICQDYADNSKEKDFLDKLWDALKLFFSKKNPILVFLRKRL